MNNNDKKRLPGSEKLTRPEEISALSKYLGDIKKTQDEHTKLEEDSLEVPGRTTGYIPNIDTLPDSALRLEDGREISLETTRQKLEGSRVDVKLEDEIKLLEVNEPNISLPNSYEKLETTSSGVIEGLDDTKVNLETGNTDELNLDLTKVILENTEEDINLDETKIKLDSEDKVTELTDTKVNLEKEPDEISLVDSLLGLGKEPEDVELEETKINLNKEDKEINLSEKRINLDAAENIELEKDRLKMIGPEKEVKVELSDFIDKINDEREAKLSDLLVTIDKEEKVSKLDDSIVTGPEKVEPELEKKRLDIDKNEVESLEDKKLTIEPKDVDGLYDSVIETPTNLEHEGWNGESLYDTVMDRPKSDNLSSQLLEQSGIGEDGKDPVFESYRAMLDLPEDLKYEKILEMASTMGGYGAQIAALLSSYLNGDEITEDRAKEFQNRLKALLEKTIYLIGKENKWDDSNFEAKAINNSNNEGAKMFFDNYDKMNKYYSGIPFNDDIAWRESDPKARTLNSSNDNKAKEFFDNYGGDVPSTEKRKMPSYVRMPSYKLSERGVLDSLNISNYLRFVAENMLYNDPVWSTGFGGKARKFLLDEIIGMLYLAREQLEKVSRSNRDRLPGGDFGLVSKLASGGAAGAVDSLKNSVLDAVQNAFNGSIDVDKTNPLNRPDVDPITRERGMTTMFELGNTRQEHQDENADSLGELLGKRLSDAIFGGLGEDFLPYINQQYSFRDNYWNGVGIATTMSELCEMYEEPNDGFSGSIYGLEYMLNLIKDSPYITTPSKFGTIENGRYGTMTLDTNAYWEITMEPFCNELLNGGYSFLPAIGEINTINSTLHNAKTYYSKWIPYVSFDLEKSKLTSKSLGLYDGEINYPITSELTNELRITIVDDQYKSWRNYFQKCADVSVYSSLAHKKDYYYEDDYHWRTGQAPTIVDKTQPIAAFYQNITFEIKIYLMTPQYSTVRKFDLLCVLRDFQETYSGDIDAGGTDLNLTFSIVGENPPREKEGQSVDQAWANERRAKQQAMRDKFQSGKKNSSLIKLL